MEPHLSTRYHLGLFACTCAHTPHTRVHNTHIRLPAHHFALPPFSSGNSMLGHWSHRGDVFLDNPTYSPPPPETKTFRMSAHCHQPAHLTLLPWTPRPAAVAGDGVGLLLRDRGQNMEEKVWLARACPPRAPSCRLLRHRGHGSSPAPLL